jgi:uncharacterized membrane protein YuzA (DUF378 family)
MRKLNGLAAILTIVGGLNWGLASQLRTLVGTSQPSPASSISS